MDTKEEYSKYYIVCALFKLMETYEYHEINITDIVKKAGVGRATFYRYFKTKEDVIKNYFDTNRALFIQEQHFIPRCSEDYYELIYQVFNRLYERKKQFKLLVKAHLEFIYLEYLNSNFKALFLENPTYGSNPYTPICFAGMLFNMSIQWVKEDFETSINILTKTMLELTYGLNK